MPTSLVLVDSSIWIEFFKKTNTADSEHLDELLVLDKAVIAQPIRAEILSGAKNHKEFIQFREYFSALICLPEPNQMWPRIEEVRFRLIRKGHCVSLIDLMISLTALNYEVAIWSHDRDFEIIQEEIPLQLYTYPRPSSKTSN